MATPSSCREVGQTWSFRGTKSRNKVTVGEPAVGSLLITVPAELIPEKESSVGIINHLCTVLFFGWCFAKVIWFAAQHTYTTFHLTELSMKIETTFDNGSLGSRNDEERSEMRYVM